MSRDTMSLYERLGRRDGIARITRTLIANHLANPLVRTRFENSDMARVEQHAVDFFCAGAGGPETYGGRDMLTTHRGMNISAQEYMAAIDDILVTLDRHRIDDQTRKDVLAIAYSLKGEIVHV